jgi:CheY-like chemotaxis protein
MPSVAGKPPWRSTLRNPTAIIAEDEPILRQELRQELSTLWPELEVCAEAADGTEALQAIRRPLPISRSSTSRCPA